MPEAGLPPTQISHAKNTFTIKPRRPKQSLTRLRLARLYGSPDPRADHGTSARRSSRALAGIPGDSVRPKGAAISVLAIRVLKIAESGLRREHLNIASETSREPLLIPEGTKRATSVNVQLPCLDAYGLDFVRRCEFPL